MKKRRAWKKWTLILFITIALFPYLTVKAAGVTFDTETEIDETIGIIDDLVSGFLHISGEALTCCGLDDAIIQIGDAPIYDLLTGLPVHASSIKIGMEVRVAYFQQADEHSQALAIWLNPGHKDAAVFSTIVSENIYYGPDYTVFLSADGRYRITLTLDTFIYDPDFGQIAPEDIIPGQEFFVWVDMITASSPAQVYPDKVVSICKFR